MSRYDDPRRLPQAVQVADGSRRDAAILALQAAQVFARGSVTLVLGTATVALAGIPAGAIVVADRFTPIGTIGVSLTKTVVAATSLTITSVTAGLATQILDVSVVHFIVFSP